MEPTRANFLAQESERRQREDRSRNVARSLNLIRQADLSMAKLQAKPGWEGYVALLEARIEEDEAAISEIEGQLGDESYLPPEQIAKLRQSLTILKTQVRVRREDRDLPNQIRESAGKAAKPSKS